MLMTYFTFMYCKCYSKSYNLIDHCVQLDSNMFLACTMSAECLHITYMCLVLRLHFFKPMQLNTL